MPDVKRVLGRDYQVIKDDCRVAMRKMKAESVDSIVTEPPYGISFMNAKWDHAVPGVDYWKECLRVLKPGGHMLAFGGPRLYHRLTCAIEDAGFKIRDCVMYVYGCLDEQTEAVMEGGIKPYHRIKVGDRVLCYNLETSGYSYQPVQEVVEYEYDDTAYRLVGDHGEQVVSRNHRVIIERGGREVFRLAETRECEARVPFLEDLPGLQLALRDSHQRAGIAKQDLQSGVQGQEVRAWCGHKTSLVRVVPFHLKGKVWCLRVPTGAFVAVRNGVVFPTGNSGFPKSIDVCKAIDKKAGVEREVVGKKKVTNCAKSHNDGYARIGGKDGYNSGKAIAGEIDITIPETLEAKTWQGWGSNLKPCYEPVILARKPFKGTIVNNVLKYGTGAINIDACRIETSEDKYLVTDNSKSNFDGNCYGFKDYKNMHKRGGGHAMGRWPANLVHDGSDEVLEGFPISRLGEASKDKRYSDKGVTNFALKPGPRHGDIKGRWPANLVHDGSDEVLEGFPETGISSGGKNTNGHDGVMRMGRTSGQGTNAGGLGDSGSAARFFYCSKPSKEERGEGNDHPTVKPLKLMKWLCRLVTPPGGLVLDPFCGSGSTLVAAVSEGFDAIGIEWDEKYVKIGEQRIRDLKPKHKTDLKSVLKMRRDMDLF